MYHHHLKKRTKIFLALLPISALALLTLTTLITVTKNPKNREESHHIHIHKNIQIAHSACDGTLYRDLCVSTLSTFPDLASKSLPQIIAAAVNHTMSEVRVSESNCTRLRYKLPKLTQLDKRALDDCLELLDDSISELKSTISDLSSSNKSVKHFHDLQTLLSGAMTNQFTCLDGFAYSKSNTRPFIEARLENISHHVSNALAMVGKIKTASSRAEVFPEYGAVKGGFPTWLSKKDRRLLQTAVNETRYDVVVAKDGSGNFTTIGEAVAVAPNSSATRFVIYIKAGAYFEYVEVPKKTTMLMFLGDGIGKTWVKGNRSVGDGWTTFRSSTVDFAFLHSQYGYPNLDLLRTVLRVRERSWGKLLDFKPTYRYSGRRKAKVTDFLLEDPPEPDPTLPQIRLVPLTAEQEMAKKNRMRAMLTASTSTEVPPTQQSTETIIALPSQQPSASRRAKRARTTDTERRLVDEVDPILPPSPEHNLQPESSDRAAPKKKWAPPFVLNNRDIDEDDSVVADKDHLLAFNLARGVCLPKDMEHHSKQLNTELKALRSSTKSMILAIQKNTIAHKQIMELRKTTRHAIKDAETRAAELALSKQRSAELEAEIIRLTGLVTSADSDKQRAVTEVKDHYLREMAVLENKKNAEVKELEKKVKSASKDGFKEAEAGYTLQCEAAKNLFFKCGWRGALEKIGCGPDTEVYNPPKHFIPASLKDYAEELQAQFLGSSEDEDDDDSDEESDTPVVNDQSKGQPNDKAVRSERVIEDPTPELQPTDTEVQADAEVPLQTVLPSDTGLQATADAEFDAELDALLQ